MWRHWALGRARPPSPRGRFAIKPFIITLALVVPSATALGQVPPPPPPSAAASAAAATVAPPYGAPVELALARTLIDRALAAAAARGLRTAVAVVEPSGELVAFARMDDTQYGSITVAIRKAATAARYRLPTATLDARVQAGRVATLGNPDIMPIAGGVPIVIGGRIVGAIGISGAAATEDDEIARAVLAPAPR